MKIANQYIAAAFKAKGAELTSLKKNDQEYIWQANPKHWGRHAPVLFPFVGKLNKDQFEYKERVYPMSQHGFARDYDFDIIEHTGDSISFQLKATEQTLKVYPFSFELNIGYRLEGASLKITYEVINNGKNEMYFSIGGHPAFNCPMSNGEKRSDYFLEFHLEENLETHLLDGGLFSGTTESIPTKGKKLPISDDLFDKDALVFKTLKSDQVTLASSTKKWMTFHYAGFPYLGIWSRSKDSSFVCIEPWYGLAGSVGQDSSIINKEGIKSLLSKATFSCSYSVELH